VPWRYIGKQLDAVRRAHRGVYLDGVIIKTWAARTKQADGLGDFPPEKVAFS